MMSGRSPRSQASLREDDCQEASYSADPQNIGAMINNAALTLENEILNLEKEIEEKNNALATLNENCSTQAENIAKQCSEMEHLKMKTHREIIIRETCKSKNCDQREKCQTLKKYFSDWCASMNKLTPSKEVLKELAKNMAANNQHHIAKCNHLEQVYEKYSNDAKQALEELKTLREREKNEFTEIKAHLNNQLNIQAQEELELEEQLRDVQGDCREKSIMVNMLESQNNNLKKTLEPLQSALTRDMKQLESISEQLQLQLQDELKKKEKCMENLEATNDKLNETNNTLRDKEMEIKELDSKQKQLISQEEEFNKTYKSEMEVSTRLQTEAEAKNKEFSRLTVIDQENAALRLKCESLENVNHDDEVKITDVVEIARSKSVELEKIEESIKEIEAEINTTINERLTIESKIQELQKDLGDDVAEHEKLSIKIDERTSQLKEEKRSLTESLEILTKELSEWSGDNKTYEDIVSNLKIELERAKAISEENDIKLFSFRDECRMIINSLKEEENVLSEMMISSKQDYKKAQSELQLHEELNINIAQLEIDVEQTLTTNTKVMEELQELHKVQIEEKNQLMEDDKVQNEREFRVIEQTKADALVEVKENRARIKEHEQQKILIDKEIRKTRSQLVKCDNLIRTLETKLNDVVDIAMATSQSLGDRYSQSTNVLDTPKKKVIQDCPSPGSSSGNTFNPDEEYNKKVMRKKLNVMKKPTFIPKGKTSAPPAPKKIENPDLDEWWE